MTGPPRPAQHSGAGPRPSPRSASLESLRPPPGVLLSSCGPAPPSLCPWPWNLPRFITRTHRHRQTAAGPARAASAACSRQPRGALPRNPRRGQAGSARLFARPRARPFRLPWTTARPVTPRAVGGLFWGRKFLAPREKFWPCPKSGRAPSFFWLQQPGNGLMDLCGE
jgi:hypothetical protein